MAAETTFIAEPGSIIFASEGAAIPFEAMPLINKTLEANAVRLSANGPIAKTMLGGKTGVTHLALDRDYEALAAGRTVRVEFTGRSMGDGELWAQYSTNKVGNSGWIISPVRAGVFEISFDYAVPPMRNGNGDYLGIAPQGTDVLIESVKVTVVD